MVIGIVAAIAAIVSAVICVSADAFAGLAWLWLLPLGWLGCFLGILLLVFLMVLVMCAFVDLEKEETKDNPFYRGMIYLIADAAHTVLRVRVHAQGAEKIPAQGRVLLVCNGKGKAQAVKDCFFGPIKPQAPGSILQLHPDFILVADEEALSLVKDLL